MLGSLGLQYVASVSSGLSRYTVAQASKRQLVEAATLLKSGLKVSGCHFHCILLVKANHKIKRFSEDF